MPPLRVTMKQISKRKTRYPLYHDSYLQHGVSDPRALQEADVTHLAGENHNLCAVQKQVLVT
jgi:hypothetical protein